ncbi:DUF501 domain-containing protein [Bifidobacterium choloepi]|uniref:DUF501 domain-containing protein n=1 Tax=Bifidobacterium choloepi TaxID=2614131 RepID=A0A6I5MZQ2_9BIFI|nr:DUF501 domain-containing protein [Bifidobacterium choloepi]NEG69325.1 DUF501 domain-containing protein [Bifidobacterium choloepi]
MAQEPQFDPDIQRQASALLDAILAVPASDDDIALVGRQLGRYPRGMVAVGARCACGRPLVTITRPQLEDGTPFPTTCYLTSPEAVKAVSHLEANGAMKEYTDRLADDADFRAAYERAHEWYLAFRHELAQRLGDSEEHIAGISAGGLPTRVKCLHAILGQTLVMGEGVNPIGDDVLARIKASGEFDPAVCRCTVTLEEEPNE